MARAKTKFLYIVAILLLVVIVALGILLTINSKKANVKTKTSSTTSNPTTFNPTTKPTTSNPTKPTTSNLTTTSKSTTSNLTTTSKPTTSNLTTTSKPTTSKSTTSKSTTSNLTTKPPTNPTTSHSPTIFNPFSQSFTRHLPVKTRCNIKSLYSSLKYKGTIKESKYKEAVEEILKSLCEAPNKCSKQKRDFRTEIQIKKLKEILSWSFVHPSMDGTCGYIALFATLYPFLKDENHRISKIFFDSTGYDTTSWLPKPPQRKTISEIFVELKNNMKIHNNLYEYIEYNKGNIILAFKYMMLRAAEKVDMSRNTFMIDRISNLHKLSNSETRSVFRTILTPMFLHPKNFYNSKFWINELDVSLLSYILDIGIFVLVIKPPPGKRYNMKHNVDHYFVDIAQLHMHLNENLGGKILTEKDFELDREVVCLINDIQLAHYLGVIKV
ncbi:hypothetical protein PAEPH01_1858 [Pancytospora epiphaga]|nr:hypothetical protein PAEPH01_1858 [Pancytospora epiphaga]